jgi:hypothetical protein
VRTEGLEPPVFSFVARRCILFSYVRVENGADDPDRTGILGLEGQRPTIGRHPREKKMEGSTRLERVTSRVRTERSASRTPSPRPWQESNPQAFCFGGRASPMTSRPMFQLFSCQRASRASCAQATLKGWPIGVEPTNTCSTDTPDVPTVGTATLDGGPGGSRNRNLADTNRVRFHLRHRPTELGAGDRPRTRDLPSTKRALYQLSYASQLTTRDQRGRDLSREGGPCGIRTRESTRRDKPVA